MQNSALTTSRRLRWARVALAMCQAKRELGGIDALASTAETARVHAYTIHQFGPLAGDYLRDPLTLFREIVEAIDETPRELTQKAMGWQTLTHEQILHLRKIKNLLGSLVVIKDVLTPHTVPTSEEVQTWLDVLPSLP